MSIFSKLADGWKARKIISDVGATARAELQPMNAIVMAIVQSSVDCREEIRRWTHGSEEDRQTSEIFSYFESLYLFIHLTMLFGSGILSAAEMSKLQEYLEMVIPPAAIDSYFLHWPKERKAGMESEFISNLNVAENEYTETFKQRKAQTEEKMFASIFYLFGSNVARLCRREGQTECVEAVAGSAVQSFGRYRLVDAISKAKDMKWQGFTKDS